MECARSQDHVWYPCSSFLHYNSTCRSTPNCLRPQPTDTYITGALSISSEDQIHHARSSDSPRGRAPLSFSHSFINSHELTYIISSISRKDAKQGQIHPSSIGPTCWHLDPSISRKPYTASNSGFRHPSWHAAVSTFPLSSISNGKQARRTLPES